MLEVRVLSPMASVFPDQCPEFAVPRFEGFRNETVSFQLAWRKRKGDALPSWAAIRLEVSSDAAVSLRIRKVKTVPVRFSAFENADNNYLRGGKPGLYPDPLTEIPEHGLRMAPGTVSGELWNHVWCDFEPGVDFCPGHYDIVFSFTDDDTGEVYARQNIRLDILDAELPPQKLQHTKWLHTDCLSAYYHVPVFSEEYWRITENYIRCAVRRGINMILTPIHTPPLDTRIGACRPCVQLVEIRYDGEKYSFGFEKLHRWVEMCRRCGVEYYEMAHLFTQWGAAAAPQIRAVTQEGEKQIFGWDTPADGEKYTSFLHAYLPALYDELVKMGIAEKCIFHISDEPSPEHLDRYMLNRMLVKTCIPEARCYDALSNIAFWEAGAVEHPVPAIDHIQPFLQAGIQELWTYYCCMQCEDVPNVFITMPGARIRVLGLLLYRFNIAGFLQWGFNFYYSRYSDYLIDPWIDTDCDGFIPAGDAYQVYPGKDGEPVESIRLMLIQEAMQDLRALQLLESKIGREKTVALMERELGPLSFTEYPKDENSLTAFRHRVNTEILKYT